ncbi:MAG: alpha-isopropylmalate synthase regulatory domain-containing protein, partial [Lentisphaeria bacterium]|nr:alpha-isopropylmalate synthase regulatory domain-containing protein [Lentisphaeria bacterium]
FKIDSASMPEELSQKIHEEYESRFDSNYIDKENYEIIFKEKEALRKALTVFYPEVSKVHLVDYKVRVLTAENGTAAKVRVLLESTNGERVWTTVGVSTDIIQASWLALIDSIEYILNGL